jgi:hypothetical protein
MAIQVVTMKREGFRVAEAPYGVETIETQSSSLVCFSMLEYA